MSINVSAKLWHIVDLCRNNAVVIGDQFSICRVISCLYSQPTHTVTVWKKQKMHCHPFTISSVTRKLRFRKDRGHTHQILHLQSIARKNFPSTTIHLSIKAIFHLAWHVMVTMTKAASHFVCHRYSRQTRAQHCVEIGDSGEAVRDGWTDTVADAG